MDRSYEVSDSSDWLGTPVASLASVEAALRCQVCKDFYNTPVITSCSHTFCSLCIRRCLTSDGKCPSCRTPDQEMRLRRNWTVEELVDAFQSARSNILQLGQDVKNAEGKGNLGKRKFEETDSSASDAILRRARNTRLQSQMSLEPQKAKEGASPDLLETNDHLENAGCSNDGLSACPICGKRMKVEYVFSHLDIHQDGQKDSGGLTPESNASRASTRLGPFQSIIALKSPERLPSLGYSILSDSALRKKIAGQGLPNWGPRQLLIRRHTEWLNLWNSNCDSARPRSKRDLLQDLDTWERTQGGSAPQLQDSAYSSNTIMAKDFNGATWASDHNDDFRRLVAEARQKHSTNYILKDEPSGEQEEK